MQTQPESAPTTRMLVSTVFHRDSTIKPLVPDLLVVSSDGVAFFVHVAVLQSSSENNFGGQLVQVAATSRDDAPSPVMESRPAEQTSVFNSVVEMELSTLPPCIHLLEPSQVVSISLHCVYDFRTVLHILPPTLDELCGVVETLWKYGMIPLQNYVNPSTMLFKSLIQYAKGSSQGAAASVVSGTNLSGSLIDHVGALQIYTLAASFGLHDLAAAASEHLVSLPLEQLTDDDAVRIGPIYLKHLFLLQHDRAEALKKLMMQPPSTLTLWFSKSSSYSSAKHTCSAEEMDSITRAWSYAVANVTLSTRTTFDSHLLDATMRPARDEITCAACRRLWAERVYEVTTAFGQVKQTI